MTARELEQRLSRMEFLLEQLSKRCLSPFEVTELEEQAYRRGYQVGRKHRVDGKPFDLEAAVQARRRRRPRKWLEVA